jgi:hypothetical protein
MGLDIRAGVHTGEVEVVPGGIRGLAVHETARIMALGAAGEVLVSGTTRELSAGSGFAYQNRGIVQLKGIPAPRSVFAVATARTRSTARSLADPGPRRAAHHRLPGPPVSARRPDRPHRARRPGVHLGLARPGNVTADSRQQLAGRLPTIGAGAGRSGRCQMLRRCWSPG